MVTVGKLTEEALDRWIPMVNGEYGLTDKNHLTYDFFRMMMPYADFIENEKYYIVSVYGWDMWGNSNITIMSWYIKPEYRKISIIKQLQQDIKDLAKLKNVRYIYQGSHLDDKLLKLLGKFGYKFQTMILEV
jgi:hypothetical protein